MLSTDIIPQAGGPGAWPDMSTTKVGSEGTAGQEPTRWMRVPGLACSLNICAHVQCPRGKGRAWQALGPHLAASPLERSPGWISGC